MDAKLSEWRPGPNVCRCCLTEGCYKDISTEYFWMGKREVYAEMLSETFDLTIAYSKSGGPNSNSRLICENCIARLRDATDFKRQVKECEKTFIQHLDPGNNAASEIELRLEPQHDKTVKLESVKLEKRQSDDDFDDRNDFATTLDDDEDDLDDQPLLKLASKTPKKESENVDILDLLDNAKVTEKRKSSAKSKEPPTKKLKKKEPLPKPSASKSLSTEKKKKGKKTTGSIEKGMVPQEARPSQQAYSEEYMKLMNDIDEMIARKRSVFHILECSRVCPFKWAKNLYGCFFCDEHFNEPTWLREHNAADHSQINGQQIRTSIKKLKKYEMVKVDITDVGCKLCDDTIKDFGTLKQHLLKIHNKLIDPKYGDGVLPFRLANKGFHCVLCDRKYEEFKLLNQHMNVHFQNFICEQCGAGFMTPERLKTHAFSHETGSFQCDACDKIFRSMNAKNEHYASVHKQVKRHRCTQCSETFRNYFQRNKHLNVVHGIKSKEFKCNLCDKVFTLSGKLGNHIKAVHLKEKRHACNICEWKFYAKSELKEHMIRHGGERKYQCGVCKKAYARKYTLREHMRIHNNDRRFICAVCGKAFVQNCSLKHHMKVHHPTPASATLNNLPVVVYHNPVP